MSWTAEKTRDRVKKDMRRLPKVEMSDLASLRKLLNETRSFTAKDVSAVTTASVVEIPRGRAVLSDTVQAYVQIQGMEQLRRLGGFETENSHALSLRYLHEVYATVDRLIDSSDFQRVDYHSARIHLVVMAEDGKRIDGDDVRKAIVSIAEIREAISQIANKLFLGRFIGHSRAGIDVGHCLAINNGTGNEQEPLFIGNAANQAAKLAQKQGPGVEPSPNANALLNVASPQNVQNSYLFTEDRVRQIVENRYRSLGLYERLGETPLSTRVETALAKARDYVRKSLEESETNHDTEFKFFYQNPPLSALRYEQLMPSRTLRHDTVNIFADLCGYTKFVERCIDNGNPQTAVRALYIIRNELQAVLEKDFHGRKLRFIGDCIHGFAAVAKGNDINPRQTVAQGIRIANAMLSSLQICKDLLGDIGDLELSVGVELGSTPISRVGIRGSRSVRVTSCLAADRAEELQNHCQPRQYMLGEEALQNAPAGSFDLLNEKTGLGDLVGFTMADGLLGRDISAFEAPMPAVHTKDTNNNAYVAPAPVTPARAHLNDVK